MPFRANADELHQGVFYEIDGDITWHIATALPSYYNSTVNSDDWPTYSSFVTAATIGSPSYQSVLNAFSAIGAVIARDVVQTFDGTVSTEIVINGSTANQGSVLGFSQNVIGSVRAADSDYRHDIWLLPSAQSDTNVLNFVILHEAMHSLGFNHSFPVAGDNFDPWNSVFVDPLQPQSLKYSVMSYTGSPSLGGGDILSAILPSTLQLYDIWAIQAVYGVDTTTRAAAGDVYGNGVVFTASGLPELATIWDAGGNHDAIDASASSTSAIIDLRQGEFSSIGGGNAFDAPLENIAVAWRTVIEDAIGTDFQDVIIGNLANNVISGGNGDDIIFGDGDGYGAYAQWVFAQEGLTFTPSDKTESGEDWVGDGTNSSRPNSNGSGDDRLFGGDGADYLFGGAGDDEFWGGAGHDFIHGGEGDDTLYLAQVVGFGASIVLEARTDLREIGPGFLLTQVAGEAETDEVVSIERIGLTTFDDTVQIFGLGAPEASESPLADLKLDFGLSPTALGTDTVDFSQAGIQDALSAGIANPLGFLGDGTANAGVYVDLSDPDDQTVQYYYDWGTGSGSVGTLLSWWGDIHETGGLVRMHLANANSVIGTNFDDYLVGSSGEMPGLDSLTGRVLPGEGYSTLHGGDGDDTLVARGWETHLYGGSGRDTFVIGSGTHVEDGALNDRTYFSFIPLFGGVQPWWSESGTAVWAPFTSLTYAFPVIGAGILGVAALVADVATMNFARYRQNDDGSLQVEIGYGLGGSALIHDYNLDLNSGLGTAGITVFRQGGGGRAASIDEGVGNYVNLALMAGFGLKLPGFDPLVLDLDGDGFDVTAREHSQVYFDFDGSGFAKQTGWVLGDDALLTRDINGNGTIDDGTELFGNRTQSGFSMLSELDSNADGNITAADSAFASLRVWRDLNQDGVSQANELQSLSQAGITSISLASVVPPSGEAEVRGNTVARTGTFTRSDGTTGGMGDITFAVSDLNTRWTGSGDASAAANALPQLGGLGLVRDLRHAMSDDSQLLTMVNNLVGSAGQSIPALIGQVEDILYRWAGVDDVTPLRSAGTASIRRSLRSSKPTRAFSCCRVTPTARSTRPVCRA